MKQSNAFVLYSYCVPVLGKEKACIFDLQNGRYSEIPRFLYEVLTEYRGYTTEAIAQAYDDKDNTILEYLNCLEEKRHGIFTAYPERYPELDYTWRKPGKIISAVVEIEDINRFDYHAIFKQLDGVQCKYIELRFFRPVAPDEIAKLLKSTERSQIRSIELLLPYHKQYPLELLTCWAKSYMKLNNTVIYGTRRKIKSVDQCIFSVPEQLNNPQAFREIEKHEYVINIYFFSEAQKYNTYYNRKVCIDAAGYIKNCTSLRQSFGNIVTDSIDAVTDREDFRELWYVSNDRILDFKDSEFRYAIMNTRELEKVDEYYYRIKSVPA